MGTPAASEVASAMSVTAAPTLAVVPPAADLADDEQERAEEVQSHGHLGITERAAADDPEKHQQATDHLNGFPFLSRRLDHLRRSGPGGRGQLHRPAALHAG